MIDFLNCDTLNNCLCCNNSNLKTILDLKKQPLANSYLKSYSEQEDSYPLALNYCFECTHLQLTHAVNPDLLFKNYLYVSGTTKTLRDYFDYFVDMSIKYLHRKSNLNILDIACNDGSQLNAFKNKNHNTYGIDPAKNLYSLSSKNHNIVCDYFTEDSIRLLPCDKFDIIVAQNVLAHNSYPNTFLNICKKYLNNDGKLFIQTSQADMVKYGQFDTIYHEHISFFNVRSITALLKRTGLYLQDVLKTDIHGTSYVFVISQHKSDDNSKTLIDNDFPNTIENLDLFTNLAKKIVIDLKNELTKYIDHTIVGYGAAAKGNTLLNFGEIHLDYIIDDNKLKQGLYTPGRKIKIISIDEILPHKKIVYVPLSWNFFNEIKEKVKNKHQNPTIFIKYFPKLEVIME